MHIMLIGTDRALFEKGSVVRARIAHLGESHMNGLDSIVLSRRTHGVSEPQELAPGVHAYPTNSLSRFLYGLDALRIASKLSRPDMVSAQDPFETGLIAFLIACYFRVPLVVEVHTDFLSPEYARHSLLNFIRVRIAGFVLKHAVGGYAVSNHVREGLLKRYGTHMSISVLPIYVDVAKFSALERAPKPGMLTWTGRLTEEKNPELALRALAYAHARGHDVRLTMLGQGPLETTLRALAQCFGIETRITFAGWQDPTKYFPETELMLVTSFYEGYGMALIEALATGVPVLATDVGIAREAGALITSHEKYAQALVTWLEGPRDRGVLQLQGYPDEYTYLERTAEFYASYL